MRLTIPILAALAVVTACGGRRGNDAEPSPTGTTARAMMRDAQGRNLGDVTLTQTANGVLLVGQLSGLTEGTHAMHVHAVGRCEPDFEAAGGHFNPTTRQHGIRNAAGQHAGDLPNINVPANGIVRVEMFTSAFTLGRSGNGVFDADGSALMLHANADDYQTDPSGASGARIACGVIAR